MDRFSPVQPLSEGQGVGLAAGAAAADATGAGDEGRLAAGRTGGLVVGCDAHPARDSALKPTTATAPLSLLIPVIRRGGRASRDTAR
jgi:hypothetical protein